jgi:hypothetical protein
MSCETICVTCGVWARELTLHRDMSDSHGGMELYEPMTGTYSRSSRRQFRESQSRNYALDGVIYLSRGGKKTYDLLSKWQQDLGKLSISYHDFRLDYFGTLTQRQKLSCSLRLLYRQPRGDSLQPLVNTKHHKLIRELGICRSRNHIPSGEYVSETV